MVVSMYLSATEDQVRAVRESILAMGFRDTNVTRGEELVVIGAVGKSDRANPELIQAMPGVMSAIRVSVPYKLVSKEPRTGRTRVRINGCSIGGDDFVVMAGPCSVESHDQIVSTAVALKDMGAHALRGGLSKPRSSPYEFQGHEEEGVEWVKEAKSQTGISFITEVMDSEDIARYEGCAEIFQLGARNMQNHRLLKALGRTKKPVLVKRALSGTLEELLMSAEYICAGGNPNVILCERGIRTFETATRNTCDVSAIPALKEKTHLPVVLDPSHGTGRRSLVLPLAYAGMAAGADGLLVEVHHDPDKAMSDGAQSITFQMFAEMMEGIRGLTSFWRWKYRSAEIGTKA